MSNKATGRGGLPSNPSGATLITGKKPIYIYTTLY